MRSRLALVALVVAVSVAILFADDTGNTFGTGTNVDRAGLTAWTSFGNIGADDAANATCNATGSDYLVVSALGFSIDTGATINGVTVRVEATEHSGGTEVLSLQLQDEAAALTGAADTSITVSGTTMTVYTAGGASSLWSATLTPAIVNDADFGARAWYTTAHDVRIDFITVAVTYTLPVTGPWPGQLMNQMRGRLEPPPIVVAVRTVGVR